MVRLRAMPARMGHYSENPKNSDCFEHPPPGPYGGSEDFGSIFSNKGTPKEFRPESSWPLAFSLGKMKIPATPRIVDDDLSR
jgi:hypothetical protein